MIGGMAHTFGRLTLIRHGETDWNRESRYQGLIDTPLNETGRIQSRALAERFRGEAFDALFTSPLVRAAETAETFGEAVGLAPVRVADLRERDVGRWGGHTLDDVRSLWPDEWARAAAGDDAALGGGETKAAVQARMVDAVAALAAAHPGGSVVVVSHGMALKALVCHYLALDLRHSDRLTTGGNTGVTVFEFRRGVPRLVRFADTSHLEGVALPR